MSPGPSGPAFTMGKRWRKARRQSAAAQENGAGHDRLIEGHILSLNSILDPWLILLPGLPLMYIPTFPSAQVPIPGSTSGSKARQGQHTASPRVSGAAASPSPPTQRTRQARPTTSSTLTLAAVPLGRSRVARRMGARRTFRDRVRGTG